MALLPVNGLMKQVYRIFSLGLKELGSYRHLLLVGLLADPS